MVAGQLRNASLSARQPTWLGVSPFSVLVLVAFAASMTIAVLVLVAQLELTDGFAVAMTTLLSLGAVVTLTPPLIRKMEAGGMVGRDVNKSSKIMVAELGGIAALFGFSVSLSLVVGIQKLLGNVAEPPFLAAISVFFMASMIGLIDDISDLKQRLKAVAVAFAALPLMLVHFGPPILHFPFQITLDLSGSLHLFYWLILVPVGVTGVANAMNMSAGYNGLETGQIAIASASLMVVGQLTGAPDVALLVFGALLGCALGLYVFNRYPARVFIGDIGTLGMGAAIASGVILAHIEFYGIIAIAPAFYEGIITAYHAFRGTNGVRKRACQSPLIDRDGVMRPPPGAGKYTLAYWILSKRPMREKSLVRAILALYAISGVIAIILSLLH